MKSIITGSAGFIGTSLCVKLLERGDNVIGIKRGTTSKTLKKKKL